MKINVEEIYKELTSGKDVIKLQGEAFLSKSGVIDINSTIQVDRDLIERVNGFEFWKIWSERASLPFHETTHYPVRYVESGSLGNHLDVFMYFPHKGQKQFRDKIFGFEFVESSEKIFQKVLTPCLREIFNSSKQVDDLLKDPSLYVYMGAVLHEAFHQSGPWKMVPHPCQNVKLNPHELACWGELAADTQIGLNTEENYLPFLSHALMKIFWYGRFPVKDNDTWVGLVMLLYALETGFFYREGDKWSIKFELIKTYLQRLEHLLHEASTSETVITDQLVNQIWEKHLNSFSEKTLNSVKEIYQRCEGFPCYV